MVVCENELGRAKPYDFYGTTLERGARDRPGRGSPSLHASLSVDSSLFTHGVKLIFGTEHEKHYTGGAAGILPEVVITNRTVARYVARYR